MEVCLVYYRFFDPRVPNVIALFNISRLACVWLFDRFRPLSRLLLRAIPGAGVVCISGDGRANLSPEPAQEYKGYLMTDLEPDETAGFVAGMSCGG